MSEGRGRMDFAAKPRHPAEWHDERGHKREWIDRRKDHSTRGEVHQRMGRTYGRSRIDIEGRSARYWLVFVCECEVGCG